MTILSKKEILDLQKDSSDIANSLDIPSLRDELANLERESLETDFWQDSNRAKVVMNKISYIGDTLRTIGKLEEDIKSLSELFNSIKNENEQSELLEEYQRLRKELDEFLLRKFLSGEYDSYPAVLTIFSGQGGTEANDWASMLFRMYTMYFDKKGWQYTITDVLKGSETGITSGTIEIHTPLSFGMLKKEHGAHRLVRISPFNSQGLRQTTFAGVEVIPLFNQNDEIISIPEKDIEFKAVKSGGPGGQNVNKTSSAVQITHIPSGITVSSSTQRSQAQNRENAMKILKGKLWRIKEEQHLKEISDIKGTYKVAGWGNQIRNYVLHPYKLVKDLRTGIESSDPESVLNGDLDEFIEAEVRMK
jgi:peptide chain release factor 2